jgi:SHS2 domain-containing protein
MSNTFKKNLLNGKPLEFGNSEQIRELKRLEKETARIEQIKKDLENICVPLKSSVYFLTKYTKIVYLRFNCVVCRKEVEASKTIKIECENTSEREILENLYIEKIKCDNCQSVYSLRLWNNVDRKS